MGLIAQNVTYCFCFIKLFTMKSFVVVFLCFVAACSAQINLPEDAPISIYTELLKLRNEISQLEHAQSRITVNINDYLDNTMQIIRVWIVKQGMDPFEVPNLEEGFSVKLGLITFHGEFTLTHGWMQGLSTVERAGEATMSYEAKYLNLRLPLDFEAILINYDYLAKIMNLGPKGGIEAKIKNLQILIDVTVDMKTLEIILQGFRIVDAGKITVKFSGNPIVDWLTNVLTGLATTLLHDVAVGVVQNQVREMIEKAINQINEGLHPSTAYLH